MNELEKASQDIYGEIRQSILQVQKAVLPVLSNSLRSAERIELDALSYADEGKRPQGTGALHSRMRCCRMEQPGVGTTELKFG